MRCTFTLILTHYYCHYHYHAICRPNMKLLMWHFMFYFIYFPFISRFTLYITFLYLCWLAISICAVRPARYKTRTQSSKTTINSNSYYTVRGNARRVTCGVAAHSLIDIYTLEMWANKLVGAQCTVGNNTSRYMRSFRSLLFLQGPSFSVYCLFFRLFF
jgi:hypothetical protein